MRKEITRADRIANIAEWFASHGVKHREAGFERVSTERIRNETREELKLPKLTGEEKNGDLRAHGDAIGGHGMNIPTEIGTNRKRMVVLNDEVFKAAAKHLKPKDLY